MRPYPRKSLLGILKVNRWNEKGIVLPIALTFVVLFALEVGGLSEYSASALRLVRAQENYMKTFYIAEAATEKGVAQFKLILAKNGVAPTATEMMAKPLNAGSSFTLNDSSGTNTFKVNYSAAGSGVLTAGNYKGLNGITQTVSISASARSTAGSTPATAIVTQNLELQLIPIFQFGVFYDKDLEILPGPPMTFTGPVHTNSNIYLGAESSGSLRFQSDITAAGNILHGRKDSASSMTGDVLIRDDSNVYQTMKNSVGPPWLDHLDSNWLLGSQSRWNGNVIDSAQGAQPLNLPMPVGSPPEVMIDMGVPADTAAVKAQKVYYKANLRIIDGAVTNQAGAPVELRYCSGGAPFTGSCPLPQTVINPITNTTFYNYREAKTIQSVDINVGLLNSPNNLNFQAIVASSPGVIIYSSDQRAVTPTQERAIRLVNAATLPTKGMTVAAQNPVYVRGNYNTVAKQPSGIVGDSFNILSGSWSDAYTSGTSLSSRNAAATTVNTTIIAGNTNTVLGNYNGGFENLPRFLENWSGVTLTYSGSVITLYNSRIATGNWKGTGSTFNIYNPPNRSWSFDAALSGPGYAIPGFPSVYSVVKSTFEAY